MVGKPRGVILMVMVAGALVTACALALGTAGTARADDPVADIVAAVQGDFALGQASFAAANVDFADGDVADGLGAFYGGVDDDILSVPNNLLQGSLAAVAGDPIDPSYSWTFPVPAELDFATVVAPTLDFEGFGDFANAASDLAGGDVTDAVQSLVNGIDYIDVVAPEYFVVGSAAGLGL